MTGLREKLFFEDIKEAREGYFVEYCPPVPTFDFAQLHLTFLDLPTVDRIAKLIEYETGLWIARFPQVPIMASASEDTDDLIRLESVRPGDFFYGWTNPVDGGVETTWDADRFSTFSKENPTLCDLRSVYPGVSFRTDADVKSAADKSVSEKRFQNRFLKIVFVIWLAVFPAAWAIFEFFGPTWLGIAVLIYSLWQAYKAGRKVLGHHKETAAEREKADKEQKMAHYFYHCERNIAGFYRLRSENIEADFRARTQAEAEKLGVRSAR